jgi:AraC-like DNA-binding protein
MFFNISLCTGVLGLFIALPLLLGGRQRPANLWLGGFVFALSWLTLAQFNPPDQSLFGLFDWPLAGLGPFIYCYVRGLTGLGNSRRQGWHFLPLLLWCLALLALRCAVPVAQMRSWLQAHWDGFALCVAGFQLATLAYAAASLHRIRQYRTRLRENYSSMKARDLGWLVALSVVLISLLVLWIPAYQLGGELAGALFVFGRLLALFLLGWYGMRHVVVFLPQLAAPGPVPPMPADDPVPAPPHEKYARSGMNDAAQLLIGERLARRSGQQRDYLDHDITLAQLAERTGTSPQLLSQYLNDVLGLNFFEYINSLRVAEVQRLLGEPAHAGSALLDLAFSAGFNSKSTFNAAFKKITGMAPSAWRRQHTRTCEPIG